MSLRALAAQIPIDAGHLSRALRDVERKRITPDVLRRICEILELPADYFVEARRAVVLEMVSSDDALADRLYEDLFHPVPEPHIRRAA